MLFCSIQLSSGQCYLHLRWLYFKTSSTDVRFAQPWHDLHLNYQLNIQIPKSWTDISAQSTSQFLASYPWHHHHLIELLIFEWEGTDMLRKMAWHGQKFVFCLEFPNTFPTSFLKEFFEHFPFWLLQISKFGSKSTNVKMFVFSCLENCLDWSIERSWNFLKGLSCTNRREINVGARGSSPRTQSLCQTHIYFSLFWKRAPIKRWWVFSMVHEIGWMYWKCLGVNDICTVNLLHPMAFLLNERGKGGEMAEGGSPRFGNCTLHRSTAPLLLQWRHFQFEFYFALLIIDNFIYVFSWISL